LWLIATFALRRSEASSLTISPDVGDLLAGYEITVDCQRGLSGQAPASPQKQTESLGRTGGTAGQVSFRTQASAPA
jgi:hypothetical protein